MFDWSYTLRLRTIYPKLINEAMSLVDHRQATTDSRPALSDERGALRKEFSDDGVRLNARGYAAMREVFTRFDREARGGKE